MERCRVIIIVKMSLISPKMVVWCDSVVILSHISIRLSSKSSLQSQDEVSLPITINKKPEIAD